MTANDVKELQARFRKLAGKCDNVTVLLKRIGINIMNEISKNFREEGNNGDKWPTLSEATIRGRRNKNKSSIKILQDTGKHLRSTFSPEIDDKSVRVGTPTEFAPAHEYGQVPMPKRQMLPTYKRGLEIAIDVAESYVSDSVKEAGLER